MLKNHSNVNTSPKNNAQQLGMAQQQQRGGMSAAQNNNLNRIMVYSCDHDTEGSITLTMGHGKKLDHMGIQVKFFGRIDMVSFILCYYFM